MPTWSGPRRKAKQRGARSFMREQAFLMLARLRARAARQRRKTTYARSDDSHFVPRAKARDESRLRFVHACCIGLSEDEGTGRAGPLEVRRACSKRSYLTRRTSRISSTRTSRRTARQLLARATALTPQALRALFPFNDHFGGRSPTRSSVLDLSIPLEA